MKKIFYLFLSLSICFVMFGCNSNEKDLSSEEILDKLLDNGFISWSYKLPDIKYSYLVNNDSDSVYYGYVFAEYKDLITNNKTYYFSIEDKENKYADEKIYEFDESITEYANFIKNNNLTTDKMKDIMNVILKNKNEEISYDHGAYNPLDIKLKTNDKEKRLINDLEKKIINESSYSLKLVDYYKESTISSTLCLEFTSDDVEEYTYVVKYNLEHNNDDISTKIFSFEMELDSDLGASVERLQDFVNISSTLGYHDSSLNTEILAQVINGLANRVGSSKNYQENDNKLVSVSSSHIVTSNYCFTYSEV